MSATKPTPSDLLPTYRANLARYMAEGDAEKVRIQKALIERLEGDAG